jgi:hypothetical protein
MMMMIMMMITTAKRRGKKGNTTRLFTYTPKNTNRPSVCTFAHRDNLCSDNKVRELIAIKVLHTSLLKTTVVAFKVLPLGSYELIPAPSPPFKTILELVSWEGLQSCRCITPDVIKMSSFQYFLYLREWKKVTGG